MGVGCRVLSSAHRRYCWRFGGKQEQSVQLFDTNLCLGLDFPAFPGLGRSFDFPDSEPRIQDKCVTWEVQGRQVRGWGSECMLSWRY